MSAQGRPRERGPRASRRGGSPRGAPARSARTARIVLALGSAVLGAALGAGCRGRDEAPPPEAAAPPPAAAAGEESAAPAAHEIVLYFPGPNDDLLHGEKRAVLPIGAPEDRAKQCLEELIRGPRPPLLAAVPDAVRVRQIYLLADGTAWVDFSGELLAHRGGSVGELQTLYSVVDTLAANVPEIRRVGVLVDGRTRETLAGHVDIEQPLPADYRYVDPGSRPANAPEGTSGAPPDATGDGAAGAPAEGAKTEPVSPAGTAGTEPAESKPGATPGATPAADGHP